MKVRELLSAYEAFSLPSNEAVLEIPQIIRKEYSQGTKLFEPGGKISRIMLLKSGWAMTSKILPSGTRIVTDFVLNGDMISTTAAEFAQETIHALTDVVSYEFPDFLSEREHDRSATLSRIVFMEMIKRQARMSERLANIGRRDGMERTGHLLLELGVRARHTAKTNLDGFSCPLRQADIGDAVGLSTVHINRVLKDMRLNGLLWFRNGVVEFPDRNRLMDLVGFDSDYLAIDVNPRIRAH